MSRTTLESSPESVPQGREVDPQTQEMSERLSALRAELAQMHRLIVLGTAAATIAHEFNNLMTPVVGYAKSALNADDTKLMRKALDMALKQAAIGTAMCERILGLAADEVPSFEPVKIREVVDQAVACLCRDLAKDGITLTVDVDSDLTIFADGKQIQQVLFNLLINARQAIGERSGRIVIKASRAPDGPVELSVRDTGCGIPPDQFERIFEPFVTSKVRDGGSPRGGVGLGLAFCRDIIEQHRGTITVKSGIDVGTTFTLTLPAAG